MAKKKPFDVAVLAKERVKAGTNQKDYWGRFGVTQSAGSRYESGRILPKPLRMLINLHRSGKLTDHDLANAVK